jgi:hypothetical protein
MFRSGELITSGGYVGRGPLISRPRNAFNPRALPGLAAWYDAADSNTVLTQVGGATNFVKANSQTISTTTGSLPLNTAFTMCGWFRVDAIGATEAIFSTDVQFQVYVNNVGGVFFQCNGGNATVPNGTVSANVWYFFTLWADAVGNYVSINNGTVYSSLTPGNYGIKTSFRFGVDRNLATNSLLGGSVDETAIWSRVLTADERTFLYNSGAGRTYAEAPDSLKTNLVSWWSMNAPATGDWLDQHGSNHLTPSASRPTATTGVTFNVAQDGQTVRRWLDKSGNGRHLDQADLALQPAFESAGLNGRPAIKPDGVNDFLLSGTYNVPTSASLFVVMHDPAPSGGFKTLFGANKGSAPFFDFGKTNAQAFYFRTAATLELAGLMLDTPFVASSNVGAGSGQVWVNKISAVSGPMTNPGSANIRLFSNAAGGEPWAGNASEIIVCGEKLSSELMDKVQSYLIRKWGIAL